MLDLLTQAGAVISDCGHYRYRLTRRWADGPVCTFIMLNPSTADAAEDDPTIRRCVGFARREDCGALMVVNLFAFRATKPADLFAADDPIGPGNFEALSGAAATAIRNDWPLVAAWGAHRAAKKLGAEVRAVIPAVCLGKTADGSPRHPLYVRADAPLIRYT